ncbi:MAG: hypothetical protein KA479_12805 [Saprospiraceae bacterium]|nr:hypothetical protein [Saprospiraceae bacterium]
MKYRLLLLLMVLCGNLAMAYQVTIFGYVKKSDNTPVPNVSVLVQIQVGNMITQSKTVLTQSNGKYLAQFDIDENLQEVKALISLLDCNNVELKQSVGLSKSHPQGERHFVYCKVGCELSVDILQTTNNNGQISLKAYANNGKAPFSYSWSNGSHDQSITPDKEGTYCVTVTDHDGCTGKECITVGQNGDCGVEIHMIPLDNTGKKFKLQAITKGNGPFSYLWSTGSTDQFLVVEKSGTYCVTITNANGCTATACIEVTIKGDPDCIATITVIYDGGKAKLTANGKGKEPFSYQWSNGSNEQFIVVEKPGEYCVTITDANGCIAKTCVKVHFDKPCGVSIKAFFDGGKAKLTAFPIGLAPFKFIWSNGSNDQSIIVEKPGEYCVVIVDATGCEAKFCYTVKFDKPHECSVKIQVVPSNTPNGPIKLLAIPQGKGPFTYKWNTGSTDPSIIIEKDGEYCVVMIDASGCEAKACVKIPGDKPHHCAVDIAKQPANSGGFHLKAIPKGTAPFQFLWNTGETTQTIAPSEPGEYCVKMIDALGCISTACIVIKEPGGENKDCAVHIKLKYNKENDAYTLTAAPKGIAPFTFKWSTGSGDASISVNVPGIYCVTITDHKGCQASSCVEIEEDKEVNGGNPVGKEIEVLKSYPVPTFSEMNYLIKLSIESPLYFRVLNLTGAVIQEFGFASLPVGEHLINLPLGNYGPGLFYVQIQSANETVMNKLVKVQ